MWQDCGIVSGGFQTETTLVEDRLHEDIFMGAFDKIWLLVKVVGFRDPLEQLVQHVPVYQLLQEVIPGLNDIVWV